MNRRIKRLFKKEFYIQGFNTTLLILIPACESGFDMKATLGKNYSSFIFFLKGTSGELSYLVDDLKQIGNIVLQKISKDKNFLVKSRKIANHTASKALVFWNQTKKENLILISDAELQKKLKLALYYIRNAVGVGHLIECYVYVADPLIRLKLEKELGDKKKASEYYIAFTKPKRKSFLQEADDFLLKIKKSGFKSELIDIFLERYGWIKNSYAGKHTFSKEEVRTMAKHLSVGKKELRPKKLDVKKLSSESRKMLKEMAFVSEWQDERKKNVLIHLDTLEIILSELSRRLGVPLSLLRFALPNEIEHNTKEIRKIIPELKKRSKTSFLIVFPKDRQIFTGEEAKKIYKNFKSHDVSGFHKKIYGDPASLGKVCGRVKICDTVESLKKVKKGDILVASMTRPEYMSAMRKAAAFVTDEGGITCHAAIVAREMKKPCIIGTKIATKVLKDCDMVVVDANHGSIEIIE
ncbi:MAG TPA: PEP-utilizing enzyme [Candidatus Paceibacterota bacterium]